MFTFLCAAAVATFVTYTICANVVLTLANNAAICCAVIVLFAACAASACCAVCVFNILFTL